MHACGLLTWRCASLTINPLELAAPKKKSNFSNGPQKHTPTPPIQQSREEVLPFWGLEMPKLCYCVWINSEEKPPEGPKNLPQTENVKLILLKPTLSTLLLSFAIMLKPLDMASTPKFIREAIIWLGPFHLHPRNYCSREYRYVLYVSGLESRHSDGTAVVNDNQCIHWYHCQRKLKDNISPYHEPLISILKEKISHTGFGHTGCIVTLSRKSKVFRSSALSLCGSKRRVSQGSLELGGFMKRDKLGKSLYL